MRQRSELKQTDENKQRRQEGEGTVMERGEDEMDVNKM